MNHHDLKIYAFKIHEISSRSGSDIEYTKEVYVSGKNLQKILSEFHGITTMNISACHILLWIKWVRKNAIAKCQTKPN